MWFVTGNTGKSTFLFFYNKHLFLTFLYVVLKVWKWRLNTLIPIKTEKENESV